MRRIKILRLFTTFGLLICLHHFCLQNAQAQITLILNTPPQLPERVNDWERLNALLSVTVTNTGGTPLQRLRVAATVTNLDNNVVLFRTKNDLTRPFNAPPRTPQTLTAPQIFPANSFEYDASVQTALIRTNTLPEGAYRLCVRVLDERGATLGMEQCRTFNVIIPDPPSLISPVNGDSLRRIAPSIPLNVQFQWTQVFARFGQQSKYKLRVVPLFQGQQPRQALEGNPVLLEKIVQTSSYQLLPSDPQFSNYPNATSFVWQVQAIDPNDVSIANARAVGRNAGKSEIFLFALGQQGSRTSPLAGGSDNRTEKRKSPFDNSPKGTERIGRNTPMPMSVIKGTVKWSYRAAALGESGLQGASKLSDGAVLCTGETISALVGNNLGASPSASAITAAASPKQYPLPNMTVKVVAAFPSQGTIFTNIGGKKVSINTSLPDILLGTARTDANGGFVLEFVNPIFAKQGSYIGDSIITKTKKQFHKSGQFVDVSYQDTVQMFANTGEFENVIIKVIAESPHFLLEQKSFTITADSTRKILEVGTIAALARTFRLKVSVLKKVKSGDGSSTQKVNNAIVSVYRPQEFYNDSANAALIPEKKLKPLTIVETIGATTCTRLHQAYGDQTLSPLFLNQNGLHDRYYLKVAAEKCQTLQTVLQVNAASVAKDGIAEVHLRVVLSSAGGSLVSGNIKRLNLQNLSPSTVLATALKDNLNNVKLALVPFITLGEKVEARLNVFTNADGDFDIDSVPKGAYLLQAAGATLYFNEEFKIARWNPKITGNTPTESDSDPTTLLFQYQTLTQSVSSNEGGTAFSPGLLVVVDGESEEEKIQGYVISPLAVVCGRLTDDLENLTGGVQITDNSSMQATAKTDTDGRFAINVPTGAVKLYFKRPGFPEQTKSIQVNAPENFFIPPVQIIKFDPTSVEEQKASGPGGSGTNTNLLIKKTGMDKINPGNVSKSTVGELFSTPLMRGIATGAMSKLVNSPSMLPVGANGSNFTMSGTGYGALSAPIAGLSIKGVKGAYSQTESNLFGAFTADVFSGGKAAGTKAFGKDAGWEDVAYYTNLAASSALAPLADDEINTDAVTIYDMGVTSINRGISLAVTILDGTSKTALDKAKATIGAKSALTGIAGGKPVPATINDLKPGAQATTKVSVRIEGPESANYIPQVVDAGLTSSADVSYLTVSLATGGRVTGKVVLQDKNGNVLQNQPQSLIADISIREQGFEDISFTAVKSDGSFVLRGVRTGETTVVAALPGFIAAKAKVNLKANDNVDITLTLQQSAIALEKIFGFPVEITVLTQNGDKATADGAFVKIPNNKVFSLPEGTRIPFKGLKLTKSGSLWLPQGDTVMSDLSNLPVKAWKDGKFPDGIPLVVKGAAETKVRVTKKDNDPNKGWIIGEVFLDYGKFVQQGKGPWNFDDIAKMPIEGAPPLLRSDGSQPILDSLKLPAVSKSVNIYSIGTSFKLGNSSLKPDGIHLRGSLTLTDKGFKDFFEEEEGKSVPFTVNDFHIKPNAAIGNVDIKAGANGLTFSEGAFNFNLSAIDFTVEGLNLTGTMGFTVGSGLLTADKIGFEKLLMFTSNVSDGFSVAAGTFSFESGQVTLAKNFPIGGKGFSFGIVPNSNNVFFLRGGGEITGVPLIEKLGLTLEVHSDGNATATAAADFTASWAGVADFSLSGMKLDTQTGTLDVDGSIALGIPGVAKLSGGGFVFTYGQSKPTIKRFGGEIDLKVAKLSIKELWFAEGKDLPEPKKLIEPVNPGVGGPSADAWSEPLWLEDTRKGFSATGVAVTIPGLGLNATADFSYYTISGGRELSVNLNVDGLPPITVGPVFIQPTGGGFTVNTAAKDIAFRLFSDISILGLDDVLALKPTIMELKVGASAGLQISAKALLQLYSQKAGNATMFFAPIQKKFRVTATAELAAKQFFSVPAVSATGIANITLDLDGKEGYMYAGVGLSADVNVLGLITAKANAGVILGYKAPRTAMTPEQALVLPASYNKFSGVAFSLDTKIGQEEHEVGTHDIWICDAKVWAYSKSGMRYFLLRNDDTKAISFGFDASSGWGGGARCGCVGASIAVGMGVTGGYEKIGRGWYFGGFAKGSAELCANWCVDLDANITVGYQQNPPKTDFVIDVDVF